MSNTQLNVHELQSNVSSFIAAANLAATVAEPLKIFNPSVSTSLPIFLLKEDKNSDKKPYELGDNNLNLSGIFIEALNGEVSLKTPQGKTAALTPTEFAQRNMWATQENN